MYRGRLYNGKKQSHGGQVPGFKDGAKCPIEGRTSAKLAKDHGVDESTIRRDAKYAEAVDVLKDVAPEIEERAEKKEWLANLLSMDKRTIHNWVRDLDKACEAERNRLIRELHLACWTADEIAEKIGMPRKSVADIVAKLESFQISPQSVESESEAERQELEDECKAARRNRFPPRARSLTRKARVLLKIQKVKLFHEAKIMPKTPLLERKKLTNYWRFSRRIGNYMLCCAICGHVIPCKNGVDPYHRSIGSLVLWRDSVLVVCRRQLRR